MTMGWSWLWASTLSAPSPSVSSSLSASPPTTDAARNDNPPPPPPASILVTPTFASTPPTTDPTPPTPTPSYTPLPESVRLRRQLTVLFAGPLFLSSSILITRRALRRKALSMVPPQFHPNNSPPLNHPSGPLEAIEALNLATLNIAAFAVALIGGGMFALDVSNLEELRRRVRGEDGMGGEIMGEKWREMKRLEKEAEEEMEEWMVGVLARKEVKERARRLAEVVEGQR